MKPPLDPALFDLGEALWVLHCAEAPVPKPAADAVRRRLEWELRPWELPAAEWLGLSERVRALAARLFGADASDIAFASGTSSALTVIAQSFPWVAGDEVLAPLGEFPSNVWPWKALASRGVSLREVPLWGGHRSGREADQGRPPDVQIDPENRLMDAIGPRTRLVAASWVRFQDGLALDLPRLAEGCRARGVPLVVDGIQGAGTLPLALGGTAAFATGVHKGLLAPQGPSLLWTAPDFRARLHPMGSWLSVEDGTDFSRPNTDLARDWLPDARRLESVAPDPLPLAALEISLRLLADAGPERIAAHVSALQEQLLRALCGTPREAEAMRLEALRHAGRLGSILSFHHAGRGSAGLLADLKEAHRRRIFASVRDGYLRVALHGWHTEADIVRLAAWLGAGGGATA